MRVLALVLSLVVGTFGYLINVPTAPAASAGTAQSDWALRQKYIVSLFENVCEESYDSLVVRSAEEFVAGLSTETFHDSEVLTRFKNLLSHGVLPKGEIFTEYNSAHFEELKVIRDVLHKALTFESFFRAAAWTRQNLNCGLFVDAIYSAIINRKDCEKLSVPAPYEILPNYFFMKDVVFAGSSLLAGITMGGSENVREDGNAYVISTNYTSDFMNPGTEDVLAYFHEDIGLNTYIFLNKLMKNDFAVMQSDGKNRIGEYVYFYMKQLNTRYNLERFSNGLLDVYGIDWSLPITDTYDPMLVYSNGNDFGYRSALIDSTTENASSLQNIENSIPTIMSRMLQNGYAKSEIVNTLIDILVTGDNSYLKMAMTSLGRDMTFRFPSVLEHYLTLARDPVFWRLNKNIVDMIDNALSILPTYQKNELYFPGVEINNIELKKVMTMCENYEIDVTDALKSSDAQTTFQVKISQPRLNHKPFSMKLNVTSFSAQRGLVKIYLGPKMLPGELALKKNQFMLLDAFEVTMKKGSNAITWSSANIKTVMDDFPSLKSLKKRIQDSDFGLETLTFENIKKMTGFPNRLLLPKGSDDGLQFQLFVLIAPVTKVNVSDLSRTMAFNTALMSPGYPLDVTVEDWLFDLPNVFVKDVVITHKPYSSAPVSENGGSPYKKPYNANTYDNTLRQQRPFESKLSMRNPETTKTSSNKNFERQQYSKTDIENNRPYNNYFKPIQVYDMDTIQNKDFDVTYYPSVRPKNENYKEDKQNNPAVNLNMISQEKYLNEHYDILSPTQYGSKMFVIDPQNYGLDITTKNILTQPNSYLRETFDPSIVKYDNVVKSIDKNTDNVVIKTIDKTFKNRYNSFDNTDSIYESEAIKTDKSMNIDQTGSIFKTIDRSIKNKIEKNINKDTTNSVVIHTENREEITTRKEMLTMPNPKMLQVSIDDDQRLVNPENSNNIVKTINKNTDNSFIKTVDKIAKDDTYKKIEYNQENNLGITDIEKTIKTGLTGNDDRKFDKKINNVDKAQKYINKYDIDKNTDDKTVKSKEDKTGKIVMTIDKTDDQIKTIDIDEEYMDSLTDDTLHRIVHINTLDNDAKSKKKIEMDKYKLDI